LGELVEQEHFVTCITFTSKCPCIAFSVLMYFKKSTSKGLIRTFSLHKNTFKMILEDKTQISLIKIKFTYNDFLLFDNLLKLSNTFF